MFSLRNGTYMQWNVHPSFDELENEIAVNKLQIIESAEF